MREGYTSLAMNDHGVRRSILAWTFFWAIGSTTLSLARDPKEVTRPFTQDGLWKLDVHALGYVAPAGREWGPYPLPRMGPLCFLADGRIVATFTTRTTPGTPSRREDIGTSSLPLRLHALFVDSKTGTLQTIREWPTGSDRSRITPAPGGFVVVTPERLALFSLGIAPLKQLTLTERQEAELVSFQPEASPGAKFLLIKWEARTGVQELYKLVNLDDLQVTMYWGSYLGGDVGAVSDDGLVTASSGGEGTKIGKPGDPTRSPCPSADKNCLGGVFVSRDTLFGIEPPLRQEFSMHLTRIDGTIIFDQDLPHGEVINPNYPAVGGQRFAVAVYQGKGGSNALDIAPHYSLDRIIIYDLASRRWFFTLHGKDQGIKSISALALSPDGTLLALIDQDGKLRVYLISETPRSTGVADK